MKRILVLSLIFILLNTLIVEGETFNDVGESRQNIKLNKEVEETKETKKIKEIAKKPKMPEYDILLDKELQEFTYQLCQEQELSYETVLGVMYLESEGTFNSELICINGKNNKDQGIMQINSVYQDYHVEMVGMTEFDPFNAHHSIELGIKLLKYHYDYWIEQGYSPEDAEICMLNSYNMGTNGYTDYIKKNGLDRDYSKVVTRYKNNLLKLGNFEKEVN